MFLGLNGFSWVVVLICVIIAFFYVFISDSTKAKKEGRSVSLSGQRYLAILCCILIALVSTIISKFESFIGSPMLALIIGIVIFVICFQCEQPSTMAASYSPWSIPTIELKKMTEL